MDELFRLVFGNFILSKEIFKHSRLYQKNEHVEFHHLELLQKYSEKEYIKSLVYKGKKGLEVGDLPKSGALKKIELNSYVLINGEKIPNGVEIIKWSGFGWYNLHETPLFSSLPSSIHTVENVEINNNLKNKYIIPYNITSISFSKCPNISNNNDNGNGFIIIPNTIRNLRFYGWNNEGVPIRKGDLPNGITNLEMFNVVFKDGGILPESLTKLGIKYDINNLCNLILPNSILELYINCINNEKNKDYSNGLFNFIPPNLESLTINCDSDITPNSNLFKCNSIKKLKTSVYGNESRHSIQPNSLPLSIIELEVHNISNKIEINVIPNRVKILLLDFRENGIISKEAIPNSVVSLKLNNCIPTNKLPESLTNLELNFGCSFYYTYEDIAQMVSILPNSITSIILPKSCKHFNITLPSKFNLIYS